MLYQDLLKAKEEGRWVTTPDGPGQLNGIGLAESYVALPDPDPAIAWRLKLFGNEDIELPKGDPNHDPSPSTPSH